MSIFYPLSYLIVVTSEKWGGNANHENYIYKYMYDFPFLIILVGHLVSMLENMIYIYDTQDNIG